MEEKPLTTEPIVIVEDDLDDQYMMEKIFQRLHIRAELLFFSNGREAYNYLKTTDKKTFLIFCDINMPLMNGLEFRAKIHDDEQLRKKSIPFVFLSTGVNPADISMAYDLTVQGFFQKEHSMEDMESTMRLIVNYWRKCKHPNMVAKDL